MATKKARDPGFFSQARQNAQQGIFPHAAQSNLYSNYAFLSDLFQESLSPFRGNIAASPGEFAAYCRLPGPAPCGHTAIGTIPYPSGVSKTRSPSRPAAHPARLVQSLVPASLRGPGYSGPSANKEARSPCAYRIPHETTVPSCRADFQYCSLSFGNRQRQTNHQSNSTPSSSRRIVWESINFPKK